MLYTVDVPCTCHILAFPEEGQIATHGSSLHLPTITMPQVKSPRAVGILGNHLGIDFLQDMSSELI